MIFYAALTLQIILSLIKGVNNECWTSEILMNKVKYSEYKKGPTLTLPINGSKVIVDDQYKSGNFTLNFWVKFHDVLNIDMDGDGDTDATDQTLLDNKNFTMLRLSTPSVATPGKELFMEVFVTRVSGTQYKMVFRNEGGEKEYGGGFNLYNDPVWWFISLGSSNHVGEQNLRGVVSEFNDLTMTLPTTEPWTFTGLQLRLFANKSDAIEFFHGGIAKVEWYYNDRYDTTLIPYANYDRGVPEIIYVLDFTDAEHAQYLKNRVSSGYGPAMMGKNNHSDIHDLFFNPVNGFCHRAFIQYIQLPKFDDYPQKRQNMIYHLKFRGWALNHWHRGGMNQYEFSRWLKAENTKVLDGKTKKITRLRHGFYLSKDQYQSYLRLHIVYGKTHHRCNYHVPAGSIAHKNYTEQYGFIAHLFGPDMFLKTSYSVGCNGFLSDFQHSTNNVGKAADDYFLIGRKIYNYYDFPERPFRHFRNHNDQDMQVEIDLQYFILMEDAYRSNPSGSYPDVCDTQKSLEDYGTGEKAFRGTCKKGVPPESWSPYHEVNWCIQDPVSPDFVDCAHDMDTVASKCYRCLRYYGKTNQEGCFRCPANCIECTGPNSDQCKYCGQGYGFTGTSCRKCTDDETWDLSTNLCQKKKVRFLEADYGYSTFGEIKLIFRPLDGESDLSLYEENMFHKWFLTDINRQYYLIRTYKDLPLHRKVSISIEFMVIDTNTYRYFYFVVDNEYMYQWSPNCEDNSTGIINDFWNYGHLDQPPIRTSFTMFHSANQMVFGSVGFWDADYTTVWVRELNTTFFGCYEACATCWEDNSPIHCITCLPGYYLVINECKACHPNCATCDVTATNCTSCPGGQFLKGTSCVLTCGLGLYADSASKCQACPSQCVQCNSPTSCNSCKNGYYLSVSSCLACDAACVTCTGSATKCLSCPSNKKLRNFACVDACGDGYFEVPGNICNPCPQGCTKCTSTECTECDTGNGFKKKNNVCANPCGDGWYDVDANNCGKCDTKCATCTTSTSNCQTCAAGYAQTAPACPACSSPCVTCSNSSSACASCTGANFLSGTSCVEAKNCPDGTYAKDNICQACDNTCKTCVDTATKCLSCKTNTFLYNNLCPSSCPTGFTLYGGTTCCPNSCTACTDINTCSACAAGFYLSGTSCLPCNSNCKTCVDTATKCLSCHSPQLLEVNKCLDSCSSKYYATSTQCLDCDATCATCSGPGATECKTCITSYIKFKGICQNCKDPNNEFFISIDDVCWDKCGTGHRFTTLTLPGLGGYNSCDDGNLVNGDGCSSDCRIEKNFRCEGGSETTPDKCYSKIKPEASVMKVYKDLYQVQFTNPVKFVPIAGKEFDFKNYINFTIDGYSSPENFTWEIKPGKDAGMGQTDGFDWYKYVNISIVYAKTVPEGTKMEVKFNRMDIKDINNNTLKNQKLRTQGDYLIPDRFRGEAIVNYTARFQRYVTTGTPYLSLAITNYLVQNWVRGMASLQIIGFSNLLNVRKTERMKLVLDGAQSQNNNKMFVSPVLWYKSKITLEPYDKEGMVDPVPSGTLGRRRIIVDTSSTATSNSTAENATNATNATVEYPAPNYNGTDFGKQFITSNDSSTSFRRAGITNNMIPNLSFSFISILAGALWYYLSTLFCADMITVRSNCLMKFLVYGGERCFWISLMLASLELTIFSVNNLLHPDFSHRASQISFFSALLCAGLMVAFPYVIYVVTNRHYEKLWNPEYYHRYAYFFCEYRLDMKIRKCFLAIQMGRVILYGLLISLLQSNPTLQTFSVAISTLVYLYLVVKYKPFVSNCMNIITIITEIFWTISCICYCISAIDDSNPRIGNSGREIVDLINLIAILLCIFTVIFGMIFMFILKLVQVLKKCCDGRKTKDSFKRVPLDDKGMVTAGAATGLVINDHPLDSESIEKKDKVGEEKKPEEKPIDLDDLEKQLEKNQKAEKRGNAEFEDLENQLAMNKKEKVEGPENGAFNMEDLENQLVNTKKKDNLDLGGNNGFEDIALDDENNDDMGRDEFGNNQNEVKKRDSYDELFGDFDAGEMDNNNNGSGEKDGKAAGSGGNNSGSDGKGGSNEGSNGNNEPQELNMQDLKKQLVKNNKADKKEAAENQNNSFGEIMADFDDLGGGFQDGEPNMNVDAENDSMAFD